VVAGGENTAVEWLRNLVSNWISAWTLRTGPERSASLDSKPTAACREGQW
jgi:hypothetical protein